MPICWSLRMRRKVRLMSDFLNLICIMRKIKQSYGHLNLGNSGPKRSIAFKGVSHRWQWDCPSPPGAAAAGQWGRRRACWCGCTDTDTDTGPQCWAARSPARRAVASPALLLSGLFLSSAKTLLGRISVSPSTLSRNWKSWISLAC